MPPVSIRLRKNGPLLIDGEVTILDSEGQPVALDSAGKDKSAIAICRCGVSTNKPFCDGSHRESGFSDE